ncbi:MAG TPA: tRNA (adenosine(37)-N6)-dimethylallyltransferase MiaA [Bacillales bacterium]|nr:tRNA (adenosine(37)-N6)-dimethylallyltransferase MiaA [Bacillales bacterium]
MMERLAAIVGPTAVGKTEVSVQVAKRLNGEIINGDSMQVYRGMDIGTAKVSQSEKQGVPHHLFDIKEPNEPFSASEFQELAIPLVSEINERGRLPIVVGGTGMYIKALTHHYNFAETNANPSLRREMEQYAEENGKRALHEKLVSVDPESARKIHPNNVRRVIRALEVYETAGKPASEQRRRETKPRYRLATVGLTMERDLLYERINRRVDHMVENGLFAEAQRLFDAGVQNCPSVQAIGYKEVYAYLRGECSKEEAIEMLKKNSRRYAKKQYTWFRHQMDVQWFHVTKDGPREKIPAILEFVAGTF